MASRSRVRGRYNSSELYFINHGVGKLKITPEKWLHPEEKDMKQILNMWTGVGMHNQLEDLLGKADSEKKVEFVYKDIVLVGKADFLPPTKDEAWEFKTSDRLMDKMKLWHSHQVGLYCSMFEKSIGVIYQPVQDDSGIYLKDIGRVKRDDEWFQAELELLYLFHQRVELVWKGA